MKTVVEIKRHSSTHPWTYAMLDRYQREIAEQARTGAPGKLLLSEVAPVITCGRRTESSDLLFSETEFQKRGIEVLKTDRGGLATYHGPGQWVLFAVDRLEVLVGDRRGVRKAVEGLLDIALRVASKYLPKAHIREGCEAGVWGEQGKIASVGVYIDRGVLLHGIAINVFSTPTSFLGIRPCGLDAVPEFLCKDEPPMEIIAQALAKETLAQFWRG